MRKKGKKETGKVKISPRIAPARVGFTCCTGFHALYVKRKLRLICKLFQNDYAIVSYFVANPAAICYTDAGTARACFSEIRSAGHENRPVIRLV